MVDAYRSLSRTSNKIYWVFSITCTTSEKNVSVAIRSLVLRLRISSTQTWWSSVHYTRSKTCRLNPRMLRIVLSSHSKCLETTLPTTIYWMVTNCWLRSMEFQFIRPSPSTDKSIVGTWRGTMCSELSVHRSHKALCLTSVYKNSIFRRRLATPNKILRDLMVWDLCLSLCHLWQSFCLTVAWCMPIDNGSRSGRTNTSLSQLKNMSATTLNCSKTRLQHKVTKLKCNELNI